MSKFLSPLFLLIHCWFLGGIGQPTAQSSVPPSQVAVVLLIDNSGSMEVNDPEGMRFTAARLFSALLDDGDQIGVITFGTQASSVTPGLVTVCSQIATQCPATAVSKEDLLKWLVPTPEDGYTDVKAAFHLAATMLRNANPGTKKAVVLLTDGKPEILHPYSGYETETLSLARQLATPVMALGLTSEAQTPFLSQVATETGGQIVPVANATALLDAYLQLFGQVKDRMVMYPDGMNFWVDPALAPFIQSISFIALAKSTEPPNLSGPGEAIISPTDSQVAYALADGRGATVLTLHTPPGGEWRFLPTTPSEEIVVRAIVTSRLRLQTDMPALLYPVGEAFPLRASLQEETSGGKHFTVIGEVSFSATITRPDGLQEKISRFYDDGTHGDDVKGDGEYAYLYTPEQPGSYRFEIKAWKAIIPVQTVVSIQAVSFPVLEVKSPASGLYQIRDAPISLSVQFAGDTSTHLYPGNVVAQVTAFTGELVEVPLSKMKGNFTGVWMPQKSGSYEVNFFAPEANYLGVAFAPSISLEFEVQIIPQIHMSSHPIELGMVESGELSAGLPLSLVMTSTSQTTTAVNALLENMPGLSVQPETLLVPPGSSKLSLLITAETLLSPQQMAGQVRFSLATDAEIEILPGQVAIELEIFQPMVVIADQEVFSAIESACPDWSAQVPISLSLTGEHEESIFPALADEIAYRLETSIFQVKPGKNMVTLTLTPQDIFKNAPQTIELQFSGRDGLTWVPAGGVFVRIQPPGWGARCKVPLQRGLSGLIALGIGLVWAGLRIRSAVLPTLVTGTVRHWPVGKPGLVEEIDLTTLRRTEIRFGRDPTCEVTISDPGLADVHAILRSHLPSRESETTENTKTAAWMLEPISEVRSGYRPLRGLTPLYSETMLVMGGRVYQFFADE